MVSVAQPPAWFIETGVSLDIVGAFILGFIAIHVLRYYFTVRKYKWLRLGISFALLSTAAIGQAVLSIGLHVKPWALIEGGIVAVVISSAAIRSLLFLGLVVALEFFSLFGLYLLWTSYHESSRTMHALVAFLLLLVIYFATDTYFVFHLIALVFTALITTALIDHTRRTKKSRTRLLVAGFASLTFAQLFFILVLFSPAWFVAGSLVQILGLLLILTTFIQVVTHGKKKSA